MTTKLTERFMEIVFYVLSGVTMIYISIEIIELVYQFGRALLMDNGDTGRLLITKQQTALVLPVFFNILIAVELIDTFNIYIKEHSIKVQSILLIGLIAIGRKLLVLDIGHSDGLSNIGLASIILALSLGYYLVKKPEVASNTKVKG
jgi:uncharacterized membrane protein (DUF373 family)